LWDRYPSLGTIITFDKRGALAVKSHQCFGLKFLPYVVSSFTLNWLNFHLPISYRKTTINCTIQSASFETSFSCATKLFVFLPVWVDLFLSVYIFFWPQICGILYIIEYIIYHKNFSIIYVCKSFCINFGTNTVNHSRFWLLKSFIELFLGPFACASFYWLLYFFECLCCLSIIFCHLYSSLV